MAVYLRLLIIAFCYAWAPCGHSDDLTLSKPLGAHTNAHGQVTFALFAPGKHSVQWIGATNNWGEKPLFMTQENDGVWHITLDLAPGEHAYQYLVDGGRKLADPYATEIQWNRPDGTKGWLPEEALSVVHVGQQPYPWQADNLSRPPLENLIIYEVYIHDFCPGEGINGITKRLDYIKDLGVTALQLMPWHPFPGNESWGYNPAYHFAVEQTYGSAEDLKRLIDEAHQRGLAVIMDLVLNHAEWGSSLFRLYGDAYDVNPYFKAFKGDNWGFPKIDQESEAVKRWTADVIRYWIREFRLDGFRYDATRWTGWSGYNDWGASWYAYVARQEDKHSIQIAEHLPIEPALIITSEMDTGWHAEYRWNIREMIKNGRFEENVLRDMLDARRLGFESSLQRMVYTESHDEERVWRELSESGYEGEALWRRAVMALALPLTSPGPVMLYAGQEFGERTPKFVGWNPLNWSLLVSHDGKRLHDAARTLIHLRREHPAFQSEQVELVYVDDAKGLAAYRRGEGAHAMLVAFNVGQESAALPGAIQTLCATGKLIFSNVDDEHMDSSVLDDGELRIYAIPDAAGAAAND